MADHVGLDRQALEGGAFDRFEQAVPAPLARRRHRFAIQLNQQQRDRLVQLGQREELPMPQRRQKPTTGLQNAVLDPRLVARLA